MKKKKKSTLDLLEEEYMIHYPDEDDEIYYLKEALSKALNPLERKIYLTWLENDTYTAAAKVYNVSVPTLSRYINKLKAKIIEYVDANIKSIDDKLDNDADS